jgi:hypothetical protein
MSRCLRPFGQHGVDFRYLDGFRYAEERKDLGLNPGQIQLIPRKSMPFTPMEHGLP